MDDLASNQEFLQDLASGPEIIKITPQFDFKGYHIGVEDIKSEVDGIVQRIDEASEEKGLLIVRSANRWIEQAKNRPIPQKLFGEFWFEGELCILFADTNLGKSILAVQIADSISRGEPIRGFQMEAEKQPVLYIDFELSDKQFENRYSFNFLQHYTFSENFHRAEINPDALIPENYTSFENYLNYSLEKSIIEKDTKILIIDNLTYLKSETEKAKDALPLMKHLKSLKSKYGLSILALAHTPKRDLSKPITRNDLQGSKMLINFCDSSFSIGESHNDKNLRYLKQIKARNTEIVFDTDNVCVCQIKKPFNFLQFDLLNFSTEREHLKALTDKDKGQKIAEVLDMKRQGISNIEIARRFSVSEGAIRKWIKKANEIEPE